VRRRHALDWWRSLLSRLLTQLKLPALFLQGALGREAITDEYLMTTYKVSDICRRFGCVCAALCHEVNAVIVPTEHLPRPLTTPPCRPR
jgi:hypothetical protein